MGIYLTALFLAFSLGTPSIAHENGLFQAKGADSQASVVVAPSDPPATNVPPILRKIAECESGGRHLDEYGAIVRGAHNPYDVGKYQINALYWADDAKKLGYNLYTEEGNEAMAIELYRRYNTKPWIWSKECWGKHQTDSPNTR